MLATAKSQLRANNVADISTLNGRVDALQESTLELLHLHNQLLARKRVDSKSYLSLFYS